MMRRRFSRFLLMMMIAVCFAAGVNGQQKLQEVRGTVVAYDKYSGICLVDLPVTCKFYFIVRPDDAERVDNPSYIKVAYLIEDEDISREVFKGGRWRFELERNVACDGIEEFAYTVINGKYVINRPRWRTLPGAELERLPFETTIPCYTLRAGKYTAASHGRD